MFGWFSAEAERASRLNLSRPDGSENGTDAPICQDTRSGGLDDLLTSAEVGHDALVNLSRQEAFQAADDVAFGPASGEASGDVVAGRLVELHPDDDGSIEGRGWRVGGRLD